MNKAHRAGSKESMTLSHGQGFRRGRSDAWKKARARQEKAGTAAERCWQVHSRHLPRCVRSLRYCNMRVGGSLPFPLLWFFLPRHCRCCKALPQLLLIPSQLSMLIDATICLVPNLSPTSSFSIDSPFLPRFPRLPLPRNLTRDYPFCPPYSHALSSAEKPSLRHLRRTATPC